MAARRCVELLPAVGAALVWATMGNAQPANVYIEVSECIALRSDAERFDCFERLTAAALSDAGSSGRAENPLPRPAERSSAGPIDVFVQSPPPLSRGLPDEIRSSIVALDERRPNEHVIALDNGQVWRQAQAKRYPLRVGQDVRVYATRWGDSYRLSAIELNGYIQVERIE